MTADTRTATDGGWTFDGFGEGFDAHVVAHLPHYENVQHLVTLCAGYMLPTGGTIVDLGASTGTTIRHIADTYPTRALTAHLYDNDQSMLDAADTRLTGHPALTRTLFHHADVTDPAAWTHHDANLTIALWLLQFLNPDQRRTLLARARSHSSPHGAILIAAKTRHGDTRWQEIADAALAEHKTRHGVTPDEQAAKTRSLRGVLIPDTPYEVATELRAVGWSNPTVLFRWHVWTVIGAWASPVNDTPL